MAKLAINGLGRIGRAALKLILERSGWELVAINDIAPAEDLAYLLRFDSAYGRYEKEVHARSGELDIGGRRIPVLCEKDPARLPWRDLGVDLVFECTGRFTRRADLDEHLAAGARRVVLSAPAKDDDVPVVVFGASYPEPSARVVSCASCTTNCITPVVEIVGRRVGLKKAAMTTVHAYTSSQALVDMPSKKVRRGRAAAANLVPTTTGAAIATTRVLPSLAGRFDGVAVRAPVLVGSIADMTFVTARPTTRDELNQILTEEARTDRYRDVLGASDEPLVSSDVIRDPRASVVDLEMTQVIDGDLAKVMAWYDNEWGYASQMVRTAAHWLR